MFRAGRCVHTDIRMTYSIVKIITQVPSTRCMLSLMFLLSSLPSFSTSSVSQINTPDEMKINVCHTARLCQPSLEGKR